MQVSSTVVELYDVLFKNSVLGEKSRFSVTSINTDSTLNKRGKV